MDIGVSILLGVLQGLTEFLPVSSSGHLVLAQNLFGIRKPELLFDTALHAGTLVSVIIYFRLDLKAMFWESCRFAADFCKHRCTWAEILKNPHASLSLWTVVGTIPTAVIGFLFRVPLEALFSSGTTTGFMLLFTGGILFISRWAHEGTGQPDRIGLWPALAVGTAQGVAIIPGISRSGATIVCGLFCGVDRELAARFSFLLSIPAILGAMVLQFSMEEFQGVGIGAIVAGFMASVGTGLIALRLLMGLVRKGRISYFAPYCWAVGLAAVMV
jgi:undecaprenyl-diphosphatase